MSTGPNFVNNGILNVNASNGLGLFPTCGTQTMIGGGHDQYDGKQPVHGEHYLLW
jgi:hypothetical protein